MANFCSKCGRPLVNGQTCNCDLSNNNQSSAFNNPQPFQSQRTETPKENREFDNGTYNYYETSNGQEKVKVTVSFPKLKFPKFDCSSPRNLVSSIKDNIGIGDSETNRNKCYEDDMQIVPDNLRASDGEIPVKQYNFAILRTKMSFMKAKGRLQVTNKRLIFHAPGHSLIGRTMLQSEFGINQIHGIRVQNGYRFSFGNLFISMLLILLCSALAATIVESSVGFAIFIAVIFALSSIYTFFFVKRHFLLKTIFNGAALSSFAMSFMESENGFLMFITIVWLILTVVAVALYCWTQDLQFLVDTASGTPAVVISRERGSGIFGLFGHHKQESTGYREVIPDVDADIAIRELNTIISDLQTMGDLAVDKWKQN